MIRTLSATRYNLPRHGDITYQVEDDSQGDMEMTEAIDAELAKEVGTEDKRLMAGVQGLEMLLNYYRAS